MVGHLFAAQQRAHDRDRLAQGGQRTILVLKPMRSTASPMPDPMPSRARPPRQFVERADLHGDQRRMAVVGIEHAGADADLGLGRKRAGRRRRQHAACERVFRKPDRVDAGRLRRVRLRDAGLRRHPAVQTHAQPRQIAHVALSNKPPARTGPGHTPPGRAPALAAEKCACTTRHSPSSLRNTMVEREMNSWLL